MSQRFVSPGHSYARAAVDDYRFSVVPRQGGKLITCPWWRFIDRVERADESCPPRPISELFREHFDCRNQDLAGSCVIHRGLSSTRHFQWPFVVGVHSAAGWRWFAFQRRFVRPLAKEVQRILTTAEQGGFDPPPTASPARIEFPNGAPDAVVALAG